MLFCSPGTAPEGSTPLPALAGLNESSSNQLEGHGSVNFFLKLEETDLLLYFADTVLVTSDPGENHFLNPMNV